MKAVFLTGIRQMQSRDISQPQRKLPSDVLLKVDTVGVCGSDMHYFRQGRIGDQVVQFPWIVGHECAATVAEVGPQANGLKVGDRVAVDPLIWCDKCDQCLSGRIHTCRNQYFLGVPGQLAGCLTEYIVMPAASCFKVPETMDQVQAALVEPYCIGLYAYRLAAGGEKSPLASPRMAILGCGPIGLSVLSAIRASGGGKVYATDIRDYRSENAGSCGADWTGNPDRQDIVEEILRREHLGLDYVFECAGEADTIDQAFKLLKPGGKLLLVGIPEFDRISLSADLLRRKEIVVQPVRRQNHCVKPGIEHIAIGKVKLQQMVTHHFPLGQTGQAFSTVADYSDNVIKAMIDII